jgi:hypothetical protein
MLSNLLSALAMAHAVAMQPERIPTIPIPASTVAAAGVATRTATVPVMIPTVVPTDFGSVDLTAKVGMPLVSAGGYDVVIGAIPNCEGAACAFAEVSGEPGLLQSNQRTGKIVTLNAGRQAYYTEGPCGANCAGTSVLRFEQNNAHYTIYVKAGSLGEAAAIANGLSVPEIGVE